MPEFDLDALADQELADGFAADAAEDAWWQEQAEQEARDRVGEELSAWIAPDEAAALVEPLPPLVALARKEELELDPDQVADIVERTKDELLTSDAEPGPDGINWNADTSSVTSRAYAMGSALRWPLRARRQAPRWARARTAPRPRAVAGRRSSRSTRAGPARQDDPEESVDSLRRRSRVRGAA